MTKPMQRRQFIQVTAGASAGLLAASFARGATSGSARRFSAQDPKIHPLLAKMTLEEKIGQMTQAEQNALKQQEDIEKYFLGSLLSGGSSDPKAGNSLQAWTEMVAGYQTHALKTRLAIPLIFGVDAVHGHNNVLGATVFPHNVGLGCANNPELVEKAARVTALEVRATGIPWTFAPCVAVPQDARWGRTYEGFGEDPAIARRLGAAAVRGLQGDDLAKPTSVLACAKHFIGDGGTSMGTGRPQGKDKVRILDQGDTRLDEAELRRLHLPGYLGAIEAGVGTIMPSYSSWNGVKVSGSRRLLTEILKQELGFEGFLISDYAALDQINPDYKSAVEISINAGMDMVMVPNEYVRFFNVLRDLVNEGRVPMSRIDDAVIRILRVKSAMGLLEKAPSITVDTKLQQKFGSPEHRKVARECVRESIVLLKNDKNLLPLSKKARIHVAGVSADDIGNQCGGWTIDWQGKSGEVTPGGTTILTAIKQAVGPAGQITFSKDGSEAKGADVAVLVAAEKPYAEGAGDRENLALGPDDLAVADRIMEAGVPLVVILLSGRPLVLGDLIDKCGAFLAAWLPGTEGQGVADILFGANKPTGKLCMSWPRSMAQITTHKGDAGYDPLFPLGYGLTYTR
jgi:beta-glucosidase